MSMGTWKKKLLAKQGKRSTNGKGKRSRIRVCIPPKDGWPGGDPLDNGYRARAK